jgi:hypothetical protein
VNEVLLNQRQIEIPTKEIRITKPVILPFGTLVSFLVVPITRFLIVCINKQPWMLKNKKANSKPKKDNECHGVGHNN